MYKENSESGDEEMELSAGPKRKTSKQNKTQQSPYYLSRPGPLAALEGGKKLSEKPQISEAPAMGANPAFPAPEGGQYAGNNPQAKNATISPTIPGQQYPGGYVSNMVNPYVYSNPYYIADQNGMMMPPYQGYSDTSYFNPEAYSNYLWSTMQQSTTSNQVPYLDPMGYGNPPFPQSTPKEANGNENGKKVFPTQ